MAIDWDFISELEGGRVLTGYVPAPDVSMSGVTVATGVDLGQISEAGLDELEVAPVLKAKLKPYLGHKKQAAVDFLADNPLEITETEAGTLDRANKAGKVAALTRAYDAAVTDGLPRFASLPDAAQTVVASVAFQYGAGLARRTPNFWAAATAQDWVATAAELRNFGDKYPTRRNKEADLLESLV